MRASRPEIHAAAAFQQGLGAPDNFVGGTAHDLRAQRGGKGRGACQQDNGGHTHPVRTHEPQQFPEGSPEILGLGNDHPTASAPSAAHTGDPGGLW